MKPVSILSNILLFFLILIWFACGGEQTDEDKIVATVGDEKISYADLQTSLIIEPKYSIRTPIGKARRNQMDFLVQNKYYYLGAKNIGLENEDLISQHIDYIRNREILKAYINQHYLDSTTIAQKDIRKGLERFSKKLHVQNIFKIDEEEARQLQKEIITKQPEVDRLFEQTGEDLGWITFGDLDPAVEDAVYGLKTGEVSPVVKSAYGYHILRVVKEVQNPDFVSLNSRMRTQNVIDINRNRQADKKIRKDLALLAGGEQIRINNRLIDVLLRQVNRFSKKPSEGQTNVAPPVSNGELRHIELQVKDVLDETLIIFRGEKSVGYFLNRLKEMPPLQRPYLNSEDFLRKTIIDMVRNDLLLEEALKEGFENKNDVKKMYEKEIENYLAYEFGLRYGSMVFKRDDPDQWRMYQEALVLAKEENDLTINENILLDGIKDTDSTLTEQPIQVVLKNRYIW
jgi:parvulin-like peptidyl-prolyl isomerase